MRLDSLPTSEVDLRLNLLIVQYLLNISNSSQGFSDLEREDQNRILLGGAGSQEKLNVRNDFVLFLEQG